MKRIIDVEIFKNKIEDRFQGRINILEYNGMTFKGKFSCFVCGYEWTAIAESLLKQTYACSKCARIYAKNKLRRNYQEVRQYIEDNGCFLLSDNYTNGHGNLKIRFECGHIDEMCLDSFIRGSRCSICGKKRMGLSQRISADDLAERLQKKNLTIVEFPNGYLNRNSKATCICNLGHIETRSLATILKNDGCRTCAFIKIAIGQSGSGGSNWHGGATSLTNFLKKQIKQWKKDSMQNCHFCCVICGTGHRFNDVHHLYNFFSIMNESLSDLNLSKRDTVADYTEDELFLLTNKVIEKHSEHPLGVCLCRKHHKLFHAKYGLFDNTPEQWDEFIQNFNSN
jgi:hypothetical protein